VWDSGDACLSKTVSRGCSACEFNVEVVAPDGRRFGTRSCFYPEGDSRYAAITLGRPVNGRRTAANASSPPARARIRRRGRLRRTGRILALRDHFVHDTGAYTPYGIVVPIITSTQLPGPYRLPNYTVDFEVAYTNKAAVSPYRGAGRPHGAFVMERTIGLLARELGLEPAEVRRRNFVQPNEFPGTSG
jgi:CO/xanthine dehydrogenase Mo-binding subunit